MARRALAAFHVRGLEHGAADAIHHAVGYGQRIDAMAEFENELAPLRCLARKPLEWFDNARSRTPGDMKARHRIAVAHCVVAAALGPADHRENTVAHRAQPVTLLAGCERNISFGPFPRP